jgi:hypothetical protein
MNAILRDGPAGGSAVEVPQPLPPALRVEVRPQIPDGPVQPGEAFPTVSGPNYGYALARIPVVGTKVGDNPNTMWTAFYVYDANANAELAEHEVSVNEEELDADRTWEIIDGPIEIDAEGKDSRVFQYRYEQREVQQNATVILSGTAMASPEGLEAHIAEIVWSYGAAALIASLRKGKMPESITVFSDGRVIESP